MKILVVCCMWLGALVAVRAEFIPANLPPEKWAAEYDVVIAGAGTGGCGAAIQAARLGAKVLLLDETDYIGGQMNAAAVTSMDEGGTSVRERGLYKELVERIEEHYGKKGINPETAYWWGHIGVEPRVGREILHKMLAEAKVDLALRATVVKVAKDGDRVTGAEVEVVTEKGKTTKSVKSKFLVDATEWGDVLPLAGARYRTGNLTSDQLTPDKKLEDILIQAITWTAVVKQYPNGVPEELKVKTRPPGYTEKQEASFTRTLRNGDDMGVPREGPWTWYKFIGYRGMPDGTRPPQRVITRTHLNFNNDYHPTTVRELEDPAARRKLERNAILKTLYLLHYIQNNLGKSDWAVADDEGYDTPYNLAKLDEWLKKNPDLEPYRPVLKHFPVMAYARESRRMIGEYTLKARDIEREKGTPVLFPDSIAVGDYAVDLHGSMQPKYMELELDRAEDIPDHGNGKWITGPFAIPYRSLIPEKLDGFLAAEKNFSQSKLGNGATRLQPHTLLIGQAVGATAALSVKHGVQPRNLDAAVVQGALLDAGDILFYPPVTDIHAANPEWNAVQLTGTHGMLLPVKGVFGPKQPVSAAQYSVIHEKLTDTAKSGLPEGVSRGAFAAFLKEAGGKASVKVAFDGADAEKSSAITRSEAAQVIAEFIRLRGLAATTGQSQSLDWTKLRPSSDPSPNISPLLRKVVKRLLDAGVITIGDYWLENANETSRCDGGKVAIVMKKAAAKIAPGDNREPADILVEKGVISTASYWKTHAKEGAFCAGMNVRALLRGIDRKLP
ncbi:FAD-dependent oxidoreductase [Luteolibacter sp. SL250]|uniref:FAD-dependent oxidoreductase n=1 Tax=Luteolibacter sp. SL250 TaxID=2995170 RepID=UPI00226E01B7|nr:FAD-dependent oxidoreductase [Luteolibacter sp. SL250]WAC17785.1 FAD-dependent oxidoreductase [Luteolibacter sp. SL250]